MKKIFEIVFTILGGIIGCVVGTLCKGHRIVEILAIGGEMGLTEPLVLNLSFFKLTFGFWVNINLGGVIGMILFAIISIKLAQWLKI